MANTKWQSGFRVTSSFGQMEALELVVAEIGDLDHHVYHLVRLEVLTKTR